MHDDGRDLPPTTAVPYSRSRPLPPHRGILAVDMKGFTGRPAIEHEVISRAVPELLRTSLERAGLAEVWSGRMFPATTGDGYVLGFDPALTPLVIHPWLDTLQDVVSELNVHALGTARIRLRVGLHIGPLPDTGDAFGGNGTARNDTHRLLDSRPVKAALARSSEHVTQVAAILSDRCYQDAVVSGYTGRHPDHFTEVPATVDGTAFTQRAWLYVPLPSAPAPGPGAAAAPEDGPGRAVWRGGASRIRIVATAPHGNVNTGTVHGGQSVGNHHH
ncbi:hypothetical protein [Streptomyces sp. NPDC013455]|uniref:hypothetical protein n=1 Tax=Streptomyces sp. NPDC013455 TaxID=3155605 RepID=UPI0033DC8261